MTTIPTRRAVLAGGAALAATLLRPNAAEAAGECSGFDYNGVQQCTVGLRIGPRPTTRQRCENWCWAACIESIFALYGFTVPQEVIVRKIYRDTACKTATGEQIAYAAAGQWQDANGQNFYVEPETLLDMHMGVWAQGLGARVATELSNDVPLINGAVGHATVLTAMTYLRDSYGRGQPIELVVRDPWPQSPNRRALKPNEVEGTFFVLKLHVYV
ncbi:MAG: papain-like cysteine protease family protein [Pseudomonadota bacterium]